jgi:glycosyltransferase involved in cell wall biosynthesis
MAFFYNNRKNMKVLILTSAFPPEAEGAATHLPEMAAALQSKGHRIQVLAQVNRHEVRDSYSFRVRRISRSQFRLVRDLRVLFTLFKICRKCDAIYTYGIWWQASLVSLLTGIPLIIKFTGDKIWEKSVEKNSDEVDIEEFLTCEKKPSLSLQHALYRFWGGFARKLIVSCDTLARHLLNWGLAREQIEIVPNALPKNPKTRESATYLAQWSASDDMILITAGHITPAKQVDGILKVLARFDKMRLVVAGEGPDLTRIKKLTTQMNLTERVLFTGKVSRQDLAGYINESDILILNSRIGRFTYVIPEALGQNKIVLATRRGIHPDLIDHGCNGWLYNNNNIDELYEILSGIQSQRLKLNLPVVETYFTWNQQVERLQEILENLPS